MGVTRQPVVQPHLQVHHGQGRLGRHGVQEVQRVRHEVAERHGADCAALEITLFSALSQSKCGAPRLLWRLHTYPF